ncbi:sialate O-acetylesterase [Sandaracinomonas limnophila]|uniref:Sialate O-acetylesterase n=1 Tax=Sandaracinomonas limnophila TaxID=1862386 RepID=A0A437PWD3_9BACT|nr:sialate O-acetylesterase [Sandaracinomonas limnophila]RVU26559.1 sialate O-acetylesterase [Sandaracinomonas limnophila]
MKKIILGMLLCIPFLTFSQIKLPKLISDGLILQRDQAIPIWGWASPFEKIEIKFGNQKVQTQADSEGNWKVLMSKQKAGGPFVIQIKGKNTLEVKDVYLGDVFLCSGQSNMQLWMGRLKYKYPEEVKSANFPLIRQFRVPNEYYFKGPKTDFTDGTWNSVNPKTIQDFSGVAYFFAKELYQKYQVPIGIINSSLGGSPIEAWLSESALKSFPEAFQELQKFKDDALIKSIESTNQLQNKVWYQYTQIFDSGKNTSDSDWKTIQLPGVIPSNNPYGVYWLRKKIQVPANMVGKEALLELGRVADADSVFVNEQFVGTTSYQYPPRRYPLPKNLLKVGENSISVRLISNGTIPEFIMDKRYELTTSTDTVSLAGEWKFTQTVKANAIPDQVSVRLKPGGLFQAMIAPLQHLKLKGVLWYQGESNVNNAPKYGELLKTLVLDWRNTFQNNQLPFIVAQVPNYLATRLEPLESNWAVLRQQQLSVLELPLTGITNNIDLGDWNDIHPENKLDVAKRFAKGAYHLMYNEAILDASGPICTKAEDKGKYILLTFSNVKSGLQIVDNRNVKNFTIAGIDKNFTKASADISGNQIRVWKSLHSDVKYIRYSWADNPMPVNVYNNEGIPMFPFEIEILK